MMPPGIFLHNNATSACQCLCKHNPSCYLCNRGRHMLNEAKAYSEPVTPRRF